MDFFFFIEAARGGDCVFEGFFEIVDLHLHSRAWVLILGRVFSLERFFVFDYVCLFG